MVEQRAFTVAGQFGRVRRQGRPRRLHRRGRRRVRRQPQLARGRAHALRPRLDGRQLTSPVEIEQAPATYTARPAPADAGGGGLCWSSRSRRCAGTSRGPRLIPCSWVCGALARATVGAAAHVARLVLTERSASHAQLEPPVFTVLRDGNNSGLLQEVPAPRRRLPRRGRARRSCTCVTCTSSRAKGNVCGQTKEGRFIPAREDEVDVVLESRPTACSSPPSACRRTCSPSSSCARARAASSGLPSRQPPVGITAIAGVALGRHHLLVAAVRARRPSGGRNGDLPVSRLRWARRARRHHDRLMGRCRIFSTAERVMTIAKLVRAGTDAMGSANPMKSSYTRRAAPSRGCGSTSIRETMTDQERSSSHPRRGGSRGG